MPALLGQVPAGADESIYTFYIKPDCSSLSSVSSDTRQTMPTGEAEEDRIGDPQEAQCPAPRK